MQRATLVPFKDDAAPLKKKVPYDQLRPYKTSELHDMQKTEQNTDFSSPSDEFSSSSDDIQSLFEGTSPPRSSTRSPCNDCSFLAVLLNTSSSNMVIEWPSMQRQRGESDCGLFAVAVATSLLNGENPGSKSYDQSVMRGHLAVCFHCEELAVFPVSSSKCAINDKKEETVEVFCHCRMPFKDGVFMIECSVCLEWFHRSCDKVPRTVTDKTLFHCMNCK